MRQTRLLVERSAKKPFKEYAEKWRASQPHRPSTAEAVAQHLRCYAYPVWEKRAPPSTRSTPSPGQQSATA
ncbi:hypothetical protein ACFQ8O_24410 [Streptomyces coelicoflavus]|uniref:hypothetical protein n=1 Tax=Streptomyces coelicoflavus TaxID=285562 RepID=UPI0036B8D383